MKIDQEKKFTPVTIRLESEAEVAMLVNVLGITPTCISLKFSSSSATVGYHETVKFSYEMLERLRHLKQALKLQPITRDDLLNEIAIQVQCWLDWQEHEHKAEGTKFDNDTHMMHPPVWPTRGQLKAWVSALKGE